MLVHGPSNICTQPSSIPIDMFAFVLTGGKSRGCENGAGVGVGVTAGVATGIALKIFGTLAKRKPIPARAAVRLDASGMKLGATTRLNTMTQLLG